MNIEDIYHSYQPTILSVINFLISNPSFDGTPQPKDHQKRSLLPFLGDALKWVTATTKEHGEHQSPSKSVN